MKPRPLDYGCGPAAAPAAGCAGWAWRPRPRGGGRSPGVSPKCSNSPNSAAAAGAVHSEHHRRGVSGVLLRPVELPGTGYGSEVEARIERVIFACRFMTFLGIGGLLLGSVPCFLKGSVHVMNAFVDYYLHGGGKLILMLLEAIEMFLIGTVTFVLGIGLYELFISTIDSSYGSNLFGLFSLPDRPKWVEIKSLDDLKTKLGHVIVLVLLVGIFEKSKRFDEELLLLLLQLMLQFYDYIQTKRPHISCVCGCQTLSFENKARPKQVTQQEKEKRLLNYYPEASSAPSALKPAATQRAASSRIACRRTAGCRDDLSRFSHCAPSRALCASSCEEAGSDEGAYPQHASSMHPKECSAGDFYSDRVYHSRS